MLGKEFDQWADAEELRLRRGLDSEERSTKRAEMRGGLQTLARLRVVREACGAMAGGELSTDGSDNQGFDLTQAS